MNKLELRRLIATAAWFAFLAAASSPTSAWAQTRRSVLIQTCREVGERLCSHVKPGGGRIVACLQSHVSELTTQCQSALTDVGAQTK